MTKDDGIQTDGVGRTGDSVVNFARLSFTFSHSVLEEYFNDKFPE